MLTGDRVVLSALRPSDSEAMLRWISDPSAVRFNAPFLPVHSSNHDAWFESVQRDPSKVIFAIRRLTDRPHIIGVVQLIDIHRIHRSAELTMRIGMEADRGAGLGTEALRLALDFAWRDLNLHRVWLRVFATNERAIRAYEKVGMLREGVLKDAVWIDGRWVDEIVMATLHSRTSQP